MNFPPAAVPAHSRAAERERLVLLCQLDRARVGLLFRTAAPRRPLLTSLDLARECVQAARSLPGFVGRWARQLGALESYWQALQALFPR